MFSVVIFVFASDGIFAVCRLCTEPHLGSWIEDMIAGLYVVLSDNWVSTNLSALSA